MKRYFCLIIALLLVAAMAACARPEEQAVPAQEPLAETEKTPEEFAMDTEQVIDLFRKTADSGCAVQDCVLAEDGAYDLVGVVLYARQDGFTHFAFVQADGHWQTAGIGAALVEESNLEYLGNGAVKTVLLDEKKGVASLYTLEYSNDGKGSVEFVSSAESIE